MKTLSLLQPWATLVMLGMKQYETRSWSTRYRGPILIHASAGKDQEGRLLWNELIVPNRPPRGDLKSTPIRFDDLPFGKILCKAVLVDCVPTLSLVSDLTIYEKLFGNFALGRFAWPLSEVQPIYPHLPAKGSLGLWEFELPEGQR